MKPRARSRGKMSAAGTLFRLYRSLLPRLLFQAATNTRMISWNHLISPRFLPAAGAVIGLFLLAGSPLCAQLKWEATTIEERLSLGQEESEAVFRFENKGTYPVVIRSTSSSCGCTTAELSRSTYYPGDKGEILTRFKVGNRTGERRNTVQVLTDDPVAPSLTLTYSVQIPAAVTISPRLVHWRTGENPAGKTIKIKVDPEAKLAITGIEVDNGDFDAKLVDGEEADEYRVEISPRSTKSPSRAIISLQTEPNMENRPNFSLYAYVR